MERQPDDQKAGSETAQSAKDQYEVTPLGWLMIALLLMVGGFAWFITGAGSPPPNQPVVQRPVAAVVTPPAPSKDAVIAGLKADLDKERKSRAAQAAAGRALTEELQHRITEFEERLKVINVKITELPPAATPQTKQALVSSSQELQKAVKSTKASAVDIGALPIDFATAQSTGVTGFAKDGVLLGSQKIALGQKLPTGEQILAVDPESRTIVTEKRILNVTN